MKHQDPNTSSPLLDIINDNLAIIALSTFVSDAAGAPVIHIDSSTTNQLVISITNKTSKILVVEKLSGKPKSSNCNVMFKLPDNKLYFYTMPSIDTSSTKLGRWELGTDSHGGWVTTIYLANTGKCELSPNGQKGDKIKIVINYKGAVPLDPTIISIPVQVSYQKIRHASGTVLPGSTPIQNMALMANAGRPSPLVAAIVGPRAILNNGTSKQDLTLRLVNTSLDPLQFIVPIHGHPTQSYIEVVLPVSDKSEDAIWALCSTSAWKLVEVSLTGSASKGWKAEKSTTAPGVIKLTPDFSKIQNIPPGGVLELKLNGVTSGLEPGIVQVQVAVHRFVLIGTQTLGVALEKSPLIYNKGLGAGMILTAGSLGSNQALQVTGDSSSNLVVIKQTGKGTALNIVGQTYIKTPKGTMPLVVRSDNEKGAGAEVVIANEGGGEGSQATLSFRTDDLGTHVSTSAIVAQDNGKGSNDILFRTIDSAHSLETRAKLTAKGNLEVNGQITGIGMVPPNGIIMQHGDTKDKYDETGKGKAGTPYEGWAICNSKNGTPDLRDHFIVAAGNQYKTGEKGGNKHISITEDQLPPHKHDVTDPGHSHDVTWNMRKSSTDDNDDSLPVWARNNPDPARSVSSSKTNISIGETGKGHKIDITPPYYAMYYIMRIS